jgi:hypothetical protein
VFDGRKEGREVTRWTKIALWATATLCLGALVAFGAFAAFVNIALGVTCENTPIAQHWSPDRRVKLIVFERSCGATTGFSTQASLLPSHERLPDDGGNLFVADTDHGLAPSGPGGGPELRVRWTDGAHVVLSHHQKTRVFKAEPQVRGIAATYELFE